jgi:putative phosphoribosyl transferase
MIFKDRIDAGKQLADKLGKFKDNKDVVLLALPRGGIILAYEVAKKINAPIDIVVPRKIGAPDNEEFAIGAITETGEGIFDDDIINSYGISKEYIDQKVEEEKKEAERRLKVYRGKNKAIALKNKIVILIDDGIATGNTIFAAIKSVKSKKPKKIIVAVPILPPDTIGPVEKVVDELIYIDAPVIFGAIGKFYKVFGQTRDKEVVEIMKKF